MKGLLRKDFYMMVRYCRSMLLILVMFLGVSFVNTDNLFFNVYPCMLCSMLPITLISYDERSHWNQYSMTMPYTRAQLVGSKYLLGLMVNAAAVVVSLLTAVLRTVFFAHDTVVPGDVLSLGSMMLAVSLAAPSLCLPWIFKLGAEKGRLAFYGVIVVMFGGAAAVSNLSANGVGIPAGFSGPWILPGMAALYAASWALSLAFYKKKEV